MDMFFSIVGFMSPELALAFNGMVLLLMGAVRNRNNGVRVLSLITLWAALAFVILTPTDIHKAFHGMFISDPLSVVFKGVCIALTLLSLHAGNPKVVLEHPILMLFSLLGMCVMVSSNDFLTLFMGLELQSLSLYVLVCIKRDNALASEAALKYFVMGALASALFLYGVSLIYGFFGTTHFESIARHASTSSTMVLVGVFLILSSLLFKISIVPFHMWTPDVYQGSSLTTLSFIATAPKMAALGVMIRIIIQVFPLWVPYFQPIIISLALLSIIIGAFIGLNQTSIKRLLAYSTIMNMGFTMLPLAIGTTDGAEAAFVYGLTYVLTTLGFITALRRFTPSVEDIASLKGLYMVNTFSVACAGFFLLSFVGIPPFFGFITKFNVLQALVHHGWYIVAVIAVIFSVVSAYYYLSLLKTMSMDTPDTLHGIQVRSNVSVFFIMVVIMIILIVAFVNPTAVLALAHYAVNH
jgi:NADH-quinone oxidoreductase subunit N